MSENVSNSKQKRIEREKKAKAKKRDSAINNIIWPVVIAVIVIGLVAMIAGKVIASSKEVVASDNMGDVFEDNGFVKNVNTSDYITLFDYKNIVIPRSEIEYTDEQMEEDINVALNNHKKLNTQTKAAIADGDRVNIDYIGSIDGVEFDGGNSNGEGSDLTIGSRSFIDDFEEQLIGAKVGEIVNVNVDFPEDYASADLAGKNADFVVTINGIYEVPEFTDEFVAENLTAYATTVDEYKKYLKDGNEEDNVTAYLENYIKDNTTVKKYPKKFLDSLKSVTKYSDEQSFQYMNQMYMQYYGQGYTSLEEYMGMTEEGYKEDLDKRAKEGCTMALAEQAILEAEGVTISADEVKDYINETYGSDDAFDSMVEQYGIGYLANEMIPDKVLKILRDNVTIQ